ncbi:MAG: type II secretion system protein N [Gammaproteobacteria bacterium]|nr:type II secretion system protein N [Gammaproteobacteria bacterium]
MTRRWLWYALSGLALYLVFVVATAPAAWVSWALARASGGTLNIDRPGGTVWHGRGALVIRNASTLPRSLGTVHWALNPLWLFAGRLHVHAVMRGPGTDIRADVALGYHRVALSAVDASFPAQFLSTLYSPAALFGPAGQLHIDAKRFALDGGAASGSAVVQWRQAASSLSSVRPFGNYRLSLDGQGRVAALKLQTLGGSLMLTGQGSWQPANGQIRFSGLVSPAANGPALEPLLRLFGPDHGGGRRSFDISARLAAF